jgi:hypothetical protein
VSIPPKLNSKDQSRTNKSSAAKYHGSSWISENEVVKNDEEEAE